MYILGGFTTTNFSSVDNNFVEIFDGNVIRVAPGRNLLPYASAGLQSDACLIPTKHSDGFLVTGGSVIAK